MNMEQARSNMLKQQIRTWDVLDPQILDLFNRIPREQFVPNEYRELAYADAVIPLSGGMFMPPPKEEAKILQALALSKKDNVLELGTGAGYFTALLAKLAQHVYSIDSDAERAHQFEQKLSKLGINNITVSCAPLTEGLLKYAPYDVIVIKGSLPHLPHHLRAQLAEGGRIVAVLGNAPAMEAIIFKHEGGAQWRTEKLFETVWPRLPGIEEPKQFKF